MTILTDEERSAWANAFPDASLNRTDAGNGELFARLHGNRLRFDHRRKRWPLWAGHWWREDDIGAVRLLAKEVAPDRYQQALSIDNLDERRRESGFAIASENRQRLEAMLLAARSEPPIADAGDAWDRNPWPLGVANGVVDLRTGQLRPGRAEDRVTLHVDIAFDPDATCPRWERFLDEVFCNDDDLINYIWRAIGYSLTGDIREQCLFLCHGTGSNGKSVFLTVLRAMAGAYAADTPFTTFELQRGGNIPNDVAALVGRRIVTASETAENRRLNEARLKALTGGDAVTARFLHGEFFTFDPVAKFWLAVNHKPFVTDDSYGFWRRVRLIPFARRFTPLDADEELVEKLLAELPGILTWAVRGAVIWRDYGMGSPQVVRTATDTYQAESDPLGDFLEACCVLGEPYSVQASQLYRAYEEWARGEGLGDRERLTATMFGKRMSTRFTKKPRKEGKVYLGIGLQMRPGDGFGDGL